MRFIMVIRHPADRYNSAFWHFHPDWDKTPDEYSIESVDTTHQCIQQCLDKFGSSLSIEDALAGKFDWWACCNSNYMADAGHGFYAQHLRHWFCVLYLEPNGIACPSWTDPKIRGLLSPSNQRRILTLEFDAVTTLSREPIKQAIEHLQPVTAETLTKMTGKPIVSPSGLTTRNKHKHKSEISADGKRRLCDLYKHEERLLALLLDRDTLPWNLATDEGCIGEE